MHALRTEFGFLELIVSAIVDVHVLMAHDRAISLAIVSTSAAMAGERSNSTNLTAPFIGMILIIKMMMHKCFFFPQTRTNMIKHTLI